MCLLGDWLTSVAFGDVRGVRCPPAAAMIAASISTAFAIPAVPTARVHSATTIGERVCEGRETNGDRNWHSTGQQK